MKRFNKFVAILTLAVSLGTAIEPLQAQYYDNYGEAYADSRNAPYISPTVALGVVAVAAIVTVILHNRKRGHLSFHSHTHSHS